MKLSTTTVGRPLFRLINERSYEIITELIIILCHINTSFSMETMEMLAWVLAVV